MMCHIRPWCGQEVPNPTIHVPNKPQPSQVAQYAPVSGARLGFRVVGSCFGLQLGMWNVRLLDRKSFPTLKILTP